MDKIFQVSLVTWDLMKETAFWFLIGLIIAGIIHQFVPEKVLQKFLGGKGILPILWASLIGVLLPVCSCGIIPIAFALHKKGVAIGPSLALCVAAPAVNPAAIGIALTVLGFELTIGYIMTVIIGSMVIGILANSILPKVQHIGGRKKCGCGHDHHHQHHHHHRETMRSKLSSGFKWSFNNLAVELAPSLVYGFLVAGILMVIIPSNVIQLILGFSGLVAYPVTALIGAVMFVCNVGAIPFIASLISQGALPSVAIIFLITGPATNTGQLFLLSKAFGKGAAILYGLTLPLISIVGAFLFDSLYPDLEVSLQIGTNAGHGNTLWGLIFVGVLMVALLKKGHNHSH